MANLTLTGWLLLFIIPVDVGAFLFFFYILILIMKVQFIWENGMSEQIQFMRKGFCGFPLSLSLSLFKVFSSLWHSLSPDISQVSSSTYNGWYSYESGKLMCPSLQMWLFSPCSHLLHWGPTHLWPEFYLVLWYNIM